MLYPLPNPPSPLTLFSSCLFCFFFATAAGLSHCVVKVNFFFRFSLAIAVAHISALFKRARGERGNTEGAWGRWWSPLEFPAASDYFRLLLPRRRDGQREAGGGGEGADLVSLGSQLIKVNVTVVDAFYFLSLFFLFLLPLSLYLCFLLSWFFFTFTQPDTNLGTDLAAKNKQN